MRLTGQWEEIARELPTGWNEARLRLNVETPAHDDRTLALLAPLAPIRAEDGIVFVVASSSVEPTRRLLARIDDEGLNGRLSLVLATEAGPTAPSAAEPTLAECWAAELATLPSDWSDILADVTITSSDWFDRAALLMAPINPRRQGTELRLRFRSAKQFGYGASPGMVARSFDRCDNESIRGSVSVLRVLSDSKPVGTQGPVWQIDGQMT